MPVVGLRNSIPPGDTRILAADNQQDIPLVVGLRTSIPPGDARFLVMDILLADKQQVDIPLAVDIPLTDNQQADISSPADN